MSRNYKILLVDDEEYIHEILKIGLAKNPFVFVGAGTGLEAWEKLQEESFDLVLLDFFLPDVHDLSLARRILQNFPHIPVMILSGYSTITEVIVSAIKLGVYDFINKPLNLSDIENRIQNLFKLKQMENFYGASYKVIGESLEVKEVFLKVKKIANTDNVVLLQGETGTGKELIARTIHQVGKRKAYPFIPLNCSAIPRDIVEAELFGYAKGAFTGAYLESPGKFALAGNGTIFLDEIGDIPLEIQAKLLRVLQDGEYMPLGNLPLRKARARVIAASNQNLQSLSEQGKFRKDLYYRLSGFCITLPPLRIRGNDIILLANYFLNLFNQKGEKRIWGFSNDCIECFLNYDWPGNVRQLQNVIETCFIMEEGKEITVRYLLPEIKAAKKNIKSNFEEKLFSNAEKAKIISALQMYNYNRTKASRYLGIHRNTLRRKIHEYEIQIPVY